MDKYEQSSEGLKEWLVAIQYLHFKSIGKRLLSIVAFLPKFGNDIKWENNHFMFQRNAEAPICVSNSGFCTNYHDFNFKRRDTQRLVTLFK